jgi:hypothetical protein
MQNVVGSVQVIVKYASIVLTPESPEYKGGSWHVEGMLNERIVASAIAYLRNENITMSRLAFRSMVDEPEYDQSGTMLHACCALLVIRRLNLDPEKLEGAVDCTLIAGAVCVQIMRA